MQNFASICDGRNFMGGVWGMGGAGGWGVGLHYVTTLVGSGEG